MPSCDFYAHGDDYAEVLAFVFAQPGWVLHESTSEPDRPVRELRSASAVLEACPLGDLPRDFQLYAPEMRGQVIHARVKLQKGAIPGATHRFTTEGWGLVQLGFGHRRPDGGLTPSHTNHNSEARAVAWAASAKGTLGPPEAWDWAAVTRTSSRLNRWLRKVAASKQGTRPVLPGAFAALQRGAVRLLPNP